MRLATIAAAAAVFAFAAPAHAQSSGAPDFVVAVAKAIAPDAKWSEVGVDFDADIQRPIYEVKGSQNGRDIEIDISMEGEVREIEREIDGSEVPEDVVALLQNFLPNFRPTRIEHSERPSGPDYYEFEGELGGQTIDVEVADTADVITIAADKAM